jgi:hypothetical protein
MNLSFAIVSLINYFLNYSSRKTLFVLIFPFEEFLRFDPILFFVQLIVMLSNILFVIPAHNDFFSIWF